MQTVKKLLTSWHVWLIGFVLILLLLQNRWDLRSILPFLVVLLCPLMMIFMMGSHHHKK